MGISLNLDTFDDKESQKRAAIQKRYRTLGVILILTLGARLVFKNPPPPKIADHRSMPFRAIPGALKNMTPTEQARLTPTQLALFQEANRTGTIVKEGASPSSAEALALKPSGSTEMLAELKEGKQYVYKTREDQRWKPPVEVTHSGDKDTVVVFRRGGFVLAQEAFRSNHDVEIKMDRSIVAKIPSGSVQQIIAHGATWEEPVPMGRVKLKPAKGITVIVAAQTAKRISITKSISKKNETSI